MPREASQDVDVLDDGGSTRKERFRHRAIDPLLGHYFCLYTKQYVNMLGSLAQIPFSMSLVSNLGPRSTPHYSYRQHAPMLLKARCHRGDTSGPNTWEEVHSDGDPTIRRESRDGWRTGHFSSGALLLHDRFNVIFQVLYSEEPDEPVVVQLSTRFVLRPPYSLQN